MGWIAFVYFTTRTIEAMPRVLISYSVPLTLSAIIALISTRAAFAADYLLEDAPPPTSAHELDSPLEEGFKEDVEVPIPSLIPREELRELPPFIRDMNLDLKPRTYYFHRTRKDNSQEIAWALGGSLAYESGKIYDIFHMGAEVFTSQKLYGPSDKDGTMLLKPGQESYTALGTLYGTFEYKEQELSLFRQTFTFPYVNEQDIRMTPQSFEAYTLIGGLFESPKLEYGVGHISKIKEQTSTSFRYMSEVAGAEGSKKGTSMGGVRLHLTEDTWIGAVNFLTKDVHNLFYSEADYETAIGENIDLKFSLQYTDQHSVGDELVGDLSTHLWGGFARASYRHAVLGFAYVRVSKNNDMVNPYGSFPGFNASMIKDYRRAGEQSYRIYLSYNFEKLGLPFLSAYTNVVIGDGRVDPETKAPLPDDTEFDLTIDLKGEKETLKSLWLRLRMAHVWDDDGDHRQDFRVILNWEIPIT